MNKSRIDIRYTYPVVVVIVLCAAAIISFFSPACQYLYPTREERREIVIYGDTEHFCLNTIYILSPHLYSYNKSSGFRKIHELNYDNFILFGNDTLVVLYEMVPWRNNIIHVFNLKSGKHFEKGYKRKCTVDEGAENNFYTRLENGELITYWGCPNDGYRLDLQTLQLERIDPEKLGITEESWLAIRSEELRQKYDCSDSLLSASTFNIDSSKFKVYKKYRRLWHLKDFSDNDYLTDGRVTIRLDVAPVKIEDLN